MYNIFESFRNSGQFDQLENYFKFISPEPLICPYYCTLKNVYGSSVTSIIDGNKSTAYANLEFIQSFQYITIQFLKQPVYVHTLFITTLCYPPNDFLVEGSNDNKNWLVLARQDSPLKEYSINIIKCHVKKTFTFIRISQSKNSLHEYRFLIYELEIYGSVGEVPCFTNRIKLFKRTLSLFF